MSARSILTTLVCALPLTFALGCTDMGKVDQGRVVAYDKDKKVVTMIRDLANDSQNPDYTHLPPVLYTIPADPAEMGPEPKAGQRMKLDAKKKQITYYDAGSQSFKTLDYTLVDQQENIERDHPLVFDAAANQAKKFPAVDKVKKTITVYSGRQKMLTTFSLPDEYLAMADSTWDAGDEVRIYYKEDGKALRLMNISKTNIFKK